MQLIVTITQDNDGISRPVSLCESDEVVNLHMYIYVADERTPLPENHSVNWRASMNN